MTESVPIPPTMRAVVLTGHGGLDRLEYRTDWPTPTPGPGEVLVKVHACGLNNTDVNTRTAWYSKAVSGATTGGALDTAEDEDATWGGAPITFPRSDLDLTRHFLTSLCAVIYCWSMTFALMGLFRRFFASENPRIRYISDSAYWLYLMHLPLIQLLQVVVRNWQLPSVVKFAIICVATVAILLVIYEYCVRYTLIGTMLNGKRYRTAPSG